jgi:phosphonoacetaldehyde hydrolase
MSNADRKIQMVVFDWAGTTVDYASSAPHVVFDKVFSGHQIHLTGAEIDKPMGMEKKAHIRSLLSTESGTRQFQKNYERNWNEDDVEQYYEEFEKTLADVVADFSTPIDGVVETVAELRRRGLKIGSTTGYTSQIMERVIPKAKALGYEADVVMTPDLAGGARPTPFMLYACMQKLDVYPPCTVVKVGDTVVDMQEGKNAGAWSIGILQGSNMLGLSQEEYDHMDPEALKERKKKAEQSYYEAGADFVIDSIRDLPETIDKINKILNEKN